MKQIAHLFEPQDINVLVSGRLLEEESFRVYGGHDP
jgi:hypothetical protein